MNCGKKNNKTKMINKLANQVLKVQSKTLFKINQD